MDRSNYVTLSTPSPDLNYHWRVFRIGTFTTVWKPWSLFSTLVLVFLAVLLLALSLGIGDYYISLSKVFNVLLFNGGSSRERLVILDWRLPRALTGIAVGCALGLSGALMQSVTRNPLASPDILGITTGASAAAVTIITVSGSASLLTSVGTWISGVAIPLVALAGAVVTSLVMWLLAWQRGVDPFRLVLFGIIINSLLQAYIHFLLVKADLRDAASAQIFLAGSLNAANWTKTTPLLVVVFVCLPLLRWMSFKLQVFRLGPDLAGALGQRVGSTRLLFLGVSVILAAVSVAAAGPIGFVAFVAPQLAVRLCRLPAPPLVASALMGAVLLLTADLVTRTVLPTELPVGLVTSVIGGLFLVYLLVDSNRKAPS